MSPRDAISPREWWFNRLTWGFLLAVVAIDVIWSWRLGWTVDYKNVLLLFEIVSPIALGIPFFFYIYREPRFAMMLSVSLLLMLTVFASAWFNYVTTTINLPLQDEKLIALDALAGFDWRTFTRWVQERPMLAHLFTFSYKAAWPMLVLVLNLLFFTGRFARLQHVCFATLTGAVLSSALAALIPAVGGYGFYHIAPQAVAGMMPAAGIDHLTHYLPLRAGEFNHVDLHFLGLITFPSFHTTFGLLVVYAFWPFKWLRIPVIIINALLILSTPIDGGHYLTDIVGGFMVAAVVLWMARRLLPEGRSI